MVTTLNTLNQVCPTVSWSGSASMRRYLRRPGMFGGKEEVILLRSRTGALTCELDSLTRGVGIPTKI